MEKSDRQKALLVQLRIMNKMSYWTPQNINRPQRISDPIRPSRNFRDDRLSSIQNRSRGSSGGFNRNRPAGGRPESGGASRGMGRRRSSGGFGRNQQTGYGQGGFKPERRPFGGSSAGRQTGTNVNHLLGLLSGEGFNVDDFLAFLGGWGQ